MPPASIRRWSRRSLRCSTLSASPRGTGGSARATSPSTSGPAFSRPGRGSRRRSSSEPEDTGLRQEHLSHCRWLVRIPSRAVNPAFNLSQAVLLALFQVGRSLDEAAPMPLRDTVLSGNTVPSGNTAPSGDTVPARNGDRPGWREFYELERIVEETLLRCRFYHKGTPAPVPSVVKHLLRRMDPDVREMQLLLGMFGKINRALAGEVPINSLPINSLPVKLLPVKPQPVKRPPAMRQPEGSDA